MYFILKKNISFSKTIILLLFLQLFLITGCNQSLNTSKLSDNILVLNKKNINMTAICIGSEIIIIDTLYSPKIALKAKQIVEDEFPKKKITTIINTHGHYDHTFGNQVFRNVKIYGHKNTEYWMRLCIGESYIKHIVEKNSNIKFLLRPPDVIINKTKKIKVQDVDIYLIPFGNGHSSSDILIAIPDLKILFVGDIFFKKGFPKFKTYRGNKLFPGNWQVSKWIRALKTVFNLGEYKHIISGHGKQVNPDRIKNWLLYFELLWKNVRFSIINGKSKSEVIDSAVTNSSFKILFKKMGFSRFPAGYHRSFAKEFYISFKKSLL